MPIQFIIQRELISLKNYRIFLDIAGGFNIFKIYEYEYREENAGPLFSAGLSLNIHKRFKIRTGYEYQIDNCHFRIAENSFRGFKEEVVKYDQQRQQVYFGVGYEL